MQANRRRHSLALVLGLALLQACQARAPLGAGLRVTGSPAPAAKASPKVPASSMPRAPMAQLDGKLVIDASYVLSSHRGSIISNSGSNLLVVGSGLISDNGSSIISDNGSALISDNGSAFHVLGLAVDLGTLLPVRGMEVTAVSLLDGKPLGEPVNSDASGRYHLEVPKAVAGNALVRARVPGTTDARMAYELVAKPDASAPSVLDEDSAVVTRFTRACYVGQIEDLLANGHQALEPGGSFDFAIKTNPLVGAVLGDLADAAEQANTAGMKVEDRHALAQRVSDILLYHVDLAAAMSENGDSGWTGAPEPALAAMNDVVRQFREAATAKMRDRATFFDDQPYIVEANRKAAEAGRPAYAIKKPADLGDYVVQEVLFTQTSRVAPMAAVASSIGVPLTQNQRFDAASRGLVTHIGITLIADAKAKQAILGAIRGH